MEKCWQSLVVNMRFWCTRSNTHTPFSLLPAFCLLLGPLSFYFPIQQLTIDIFQSLMGKDVCSADVFVAGTADPGTNVLNALRELDIPVFICAAYRLNTPVMWALGINGSATTGQNPEAKEVIARLAALIGVFSCSDVNNNSMHDAQSALRYLLKEKPEHRESVDELAWIGTSLEECSMGEKNLNCVRRNDTR